MVAFGDDGSVCSAIDFDYDAVDEALIHAPQVPGLDGAQHPNARHEETIVALQVILEWILQKVPRNQNGIEIRATIAAWIFLPYLRSLSLTEVSAMVGRDKQSLGRWVDDFKRQFPGVYHIREKESQLGAVNGNGNGHSARDLKPEYKMLKGEMP
jgi:hypothetical protein